MGKAGTPAKAKLFIGVIAASEDALDRALAAAAEKWGPIDVKSAVIPFDFTDYYEKEMGKGLLRRWIGFSKLIGQDELAPIKAATNGIEAEFAKDGRRAVNLDPGYIELSKVVLASTKDFSHRIYIGKGIFAELTLLYKGKEYISLPWTYPDYKSAEAQKFLIHCRDTLR